MHCELYSGRYIFCLLNKEKKCIPAMFTLSSFINLQYTLKKKKKEIKKRRRKRKFRTSKQLGIHMETVVQHAASRGL